MKITYRIIERDGRFAVIRQLPGGDVAGWDIRATKGQRHFAIYREWAQSLHLDHAFRDSRKYTTRDAAETALHNATA